MGVLIDTSVLIAAERGVLDLGPYVAARPEETGHISVITASELLHGVHAAKDAGRRTRRAAFVEALLGQFDLLAIDLETARTHSLLWAELKSAGAMIGAHDLWIAAQALTRGLTVVTYNVCEFAKVPGLTLEDWGQLP